MPEQDDEVGEVLGAPGCHLHRQQVVASQRTAYRAWQEWNREASHTVTEIEGVGVVETWVEVTEVSGPLVTFRSTWVFASDGAVTKFFAFIGRDAMPELRFEVEAIAVPG